MPTQVYNVTATPVDLLTGDRDLMEVRYRWRWAKPTAPEI